MRPSITFLMTVVFPDEGAPVKKMFFFMLVSYALAAERSLLHRRKDEVRAYRDNGEDKDERVVEVLE